MTAVCLFGLGEAGGAFAVDLVAEPAVATVRAFDPDQTRPTPDGVERFDDPIAAVAGADLVIALTASADAATAFEQAAFGQAAFGQAAAAYPAGLLYADASTSSPQLKAGLARRGDELGVEVVDVALMTTVPGRGLRTPSLVAGHAADRYAALVGTWGVPVDVAGTEAGEAATRKLLRSVVMKGMAAVIVEAMDAADAAGLSDETYANIADQMEAMDEGWVRRLVEGTWPHATRRRHEMEASAAMLTELGIEPVMTRSTVEALRRAEAGRRVDLPPSRT